MNEFVWGIMNAKMISLLICLAVCIAAGCSDQGEDEKTGPSNGEASTLEVSITSPATGSVLSGDETVKFNGEVEGGKKPYAYRWSSSLDGTLSTEKSFAMPPSKMSKGGYVVILTVTDDSGASSQASITVTVL